MKKKKKRRVKSLSVLIIQLAFMIFITVSFVINAKFYSMAIVTGLLCVYLLLDYLAGHTEDDKAKDIIYKVSDIFMIGSIIAFIGMVVYSFIKLF